MFEKLFKANPYHDAQGRFSTKDGSVFASVGGVFDRQKSRQAEREAAKSKPKAKKKVSAQQADEEIDALKNPSSGFYVGGDGAAWDKVTGGSISPRELATAVLGELPPSLAGSLEIGQDSQTVKFSARNTKVYGARVSQVERTMNFKTLDVHHDYLKIREADQGKGAVRKLFAASIPVYQQAGMKSVSVYANLDAGGYAWAKYGFTADEPNSYVETYKSGLSKLRYKLDSSGLENNLPPAVEAEMRGLNSLLESGRTSKYIPHLMSDVKTPALDKMLRDKGLIDEKGSATRAVMYNRSWEGSLNFDDKRAMDRMNAYLTATPKPKPA